MAVDGEEGTTLQSIAFLSVHSLQDWLYVVLPQWLRKGQFRALLGGRRPPSCSVTLRGSVQYQRVRKPGQAVAACDKVHDYSFSSSRKKSKVWANSQGKILQSVSSGVHRFVSFVVCVHHLQTVAISAQRQRWKTRRFAKSSDSRNPYGLEQQSTFWTPQAGTPSISESWAHRLAEAS